MRNGRQSIASPPAPASIQILPPCRLPIPRAIASPRPGPFNRTLDWGSRDARKNLSKTFSLKPSEMPLSFGLQPKRQTLPSGSLSAAKPALIVIVLPLVSIWLRCPKAVLTSARPSRLPDRRKIRRDCPQYSMVPDRGTGSFNRR